MMDTAVVDDILSTPGGIDYLILNVLIKRELDLNVDMPPGHEIGVKHSLKEWQKDLPFLSRGEIRRNLRKLERANVIVRDVDLGITWYWVDWRELAFYQSHTRLPGKFEGLPWE